MTRKTYDGVPEDLMEERRHRRIMARAINNLMSGKSNNVIEVTLTANAASTAVTDDRISFQSFAFWMPLTANAAAEIGNGTMYVSDSGRVNGTLTIVHANNAQTDRRFLLLVIG